MTRVRISSPTGSPRDTTIEVDGVPMQGLRSISFTIDAADMGLPRITFEVLPTEFEIDGEFDIRTRFPVQEPQPERSTEFVTASGDRVKLSQSVVDAVIPELKGRSIDDLAAKFLALPLVIRHRYILGNMGLATEDETRLAILDEQTRKTLDAEAFTRASKQEKLGLLFDLIELYARRYSGSGALPKWRRIVDGCDVVEERSDDDGKTWNEERRETYRTPQFARDAIDGVRRDWLLAENNGGEVPPAIPAIEVPHPPDSPEPTSRKSIDALEGYEPPDRTT